MKDRIVLLLVMVVMCISVNAITRTFTWNYDNKEWEIEIRLSRETYDWYTQRNHKKKLGCFVADPYDDDFLDTVADSFRSYFAKNDLSKEEIPYLLIAFVQSLPYKTDWEIARMEEYRQYPYEMLYRGCGDCEDSAILTAALLKAMKYDVVFLRFPEHIAVGIWSSLNSDGYYLQNDRKYFYLETTSTGWKLGNIPEEYQSLQPEIISLHPEMDVTMQLESKFHYSRISGNMTYKIELENCGCIDTDNIVLKTLILTQNNVIIASDSVPVSSTLHIDEKVIIQNTIAFQNPHKIVHVFCQVLSDNVQIAEITSKKVAVR